MLYETHSHTPLCKHATGDPIAYAQVAYERGLAGLTVTCHNPMPADHSPRVRMRAEEFEEYLELVATARHAWDGRLDVRLGLECDYFPGYESWLEQQVEWADFDYLLGSVHPQLEVFRARFWNDDPIEYQRSYFGQLVETARIGLFDCLAHPDLVKNQTAAHWNESQIMDDIRRALDDIAETGIAMELNTSGANKTIAEMNPFPAMLREMAGRSIPIVIGADAHVPERVGDRYTEALQLLAQCGYREVNYFLKRRRQAISIAEALASLSAVDVSK